MEASSITLGKLIQVCPGKRHAWYESNIGKLRKPYTPTKTKRKSKKTV